MSHRRVGAILAAAVVMTLAMAGCLGKDSALQPTETLAQAAERVEELLRETIAQLPSDAEIDLHLSAAGAPCHLSGGPVFSEQSADITPPVSGAWSASDVLPIFSEFWERKGYKVITDDKRLPDLHRYHVEAADGYRLYLHTYDRGGRYDIYLTAGSPCVWEFGTPGPQ